MVFRKSLHHLALLALALQHEAYEIIDQPSEAKGVVGNVVVIVVS